MNLPNITSFPLDLLAPYSPIYVLVSGGIDSTYLYELIKAQYPDAIPVNCWNPYEQSAALRTLRADPAFLEIRPATILDYKSILDQSFAKIPDAMAARKAHKYHKKIFKCCKYIKHNAFKKDPLFQTPGSVVVSGIKQGDGHQRALWLKSLINGAEYSKNTHIVDAPTYFHRHKEGQLYCYPFRDYIKRELPDQVIKRLQIKYPRLAHSGCSVCPVLVVFQDKFTDPRTPASVAYYHAQCGQQRIL